MNITPEDIASSKRVLNQTDFIIGIKRKRLSLWKRLYNFLFGWIPWMKKYKEGTIHILKNRRGKN